MTNTTVEPDEATRLRNKVVDELRADGNISSPEIEAAMRKVPRHGFTPNTPLDKAYDAYAAVITKTDEHGVQLSSVSAPQIQAMMLEQAQVKPGMRVLEILESRQVPSPPDQPRTCISAGRCPEA